jgi:hypothetical protein
LSSLRLIVELRLGETSERLPKDFLRAAWLEDLPLELLDPRAMRVRQAATATLIDLAPPDLVAE